MLQKAAGGFMSAAEEQQVRKQHGDDEQMGKLIEILKGKQDKDFVSFLMMLRSANYGVWADELKKKAEEFKKVKSECMCSVNLHCVLGKRWSPPNPPISSFLDNFNPNLGYTKW